MVSRFTETEGNKMTNIETYRSSLLKTTVEIFEKNGKFVSVTTTFPRTKREIEATGNKPEVRTKNHAAYSGVEKFLKKMDVYNEFWVKA
jgi:hypothetical protein